MGGNGTCLSSLFLQHLPQGIFEDFLELKHLLDHSTMDFIEALRWLKIRCVRQVLKLKLVNIAIKKKNMLPN